MVESGSVGFLMHIEVFLKNKVKEMDKSVKEIKKCTKDNQTKDICVYEISQGCHHAFSFSFSCPPATTVMSEMKRLCLSVLSMGYSFYCTSFVMQKDKHKLLSVAQGGK